MTKEDIEIDEELEEILDDHGREMFLRQPTTQRCQCWDPDTREADGSCTSCAGFGWSYIDRRILAFRTITTDPGRAAYRRRPTEIGYTTVDEATLYVGILRNPGIHPTNRDWIVECRTKKDGTLWQPYLIETFWDVNHVEDLREVHSSLSYYTLAIRRIRFGK